MAKYKDSINRTTYNRNRRKPIVDQFEVDGVTVVSYKDDDTENECIGSHLFNQHEVSKFKGKGSLGVEIDGPVERGSYAEILAHQLNFLSLPRVNSLNNDELCERINWYFETCVKMTAIPTVENLSLALGYDRTTVWEWQRDYRDEAHALRADTIKRAKGVLASCDAEMAIRQKMPPVSYIFRAKNFYGMKDKVEVDTTSHLDTNELRNEDIEELMDNLPDLDD